MSQHQVQDVGRFLLQLADFVSLYAVLIQCPCSTPGGKYLISHSSKPAGNIHGLLLVAVAHGHNHFLVFWKTDSRSLKCFIERFIERLCNAQALAGGLHLRPKADVGAPNLLKGEHRHLDGYIISCGLQSRFIAQLPDGMAADNPGCQRHDGDAGNLADIGNRPRGTGIHLDDVYIVTVHNELNINHALYVKGSCQLLSIVHNGVDIVLGDVLGRIHRDTVAGVDTGTLYMLHDTGNQDVGAVTDGIHLYFLAHDILVNQNRMFLGYLVDDADEFVDILIAYGNLHTLSAQHVGWPHQHRIAKLMGCFLCLLGRKYSMSCGPWDIALLQDGVKALPVLCRVHILCRRTQNGNSHLHQGFCQLDGCLSAELHHCAVRLLNIHDALHILRGKGFKIQLIRNIKVRADGLRIIVDNNGLIAFPAECPGTVDRTEVKFNSLSNTDWAGTQNKHLPAPGGLLSLVETSETGIIVRCLGRKLSGAGVHHLINRADTVVIAQLFYILLGGSRKPSNYIVGILDSLGLCQKLCRQTLFSCAHCLEGVLHLHQNGQLVNKPEINFSDVVYLLIGESAAQRLCNSPDAHVIHPV